MTFPNTDSAHELPFAGLVAFEATARLGNISRAAEALNLTQSAVSQRVLKLEAYVGQRLFLRVGHGVKLTGAGEQLLASTRETLERLQAGLARIEPYKNKNSLLLACPPDFAHGWLMPRLGSLRALHQGMEVWLMPEREITGIDRIDVDLVISRRPLHRSDVECMPLLEDASIALAGPRWAQTLADLPWPKLLEAAPLLFLEREPQWDGLLSQAPYKAMQLQRAATVQDERLLLDAVQHEQGIAWLPQVLAAGALAQGRVVRLAQVPSRPRERLWLMRSRLTPRTPLANLAFDWLLNQAQPASA